MGKQAAIVTPVYRLPLDRDEKLSILSIRKHLPGYDHVFIIPQKLRHDFQRMIQGQLVISFDNGFFKNISGYNDLLLSSYFYKRFTEYEYILIAQLDSLVLSDQLGVWCEKGWDYVGAPWMKNYGNRETSEFLAVGNGGFSLRNVSSALEVLNSRVEGKFRDMPGKDKLWSRKSAKRFLPMNYVRTIFKSHHMEDFLKLHYRGNEDVFWGKYASKIKSDFHIPEPMEALRFAFEMDPSRSLKLTDGKLPFGCHAWARYDRQFWETHLNIDEFAS